MRWMTSSFLFFALATSALAQNAAPPPAEVQGEPISALMFFTLGASALVATGFFLWFLRKRSNRAAADRA